jgi:hypothetical protein
MIEKGCTYIGEWYQGMREGFGNWTSELGHSYDGEFKRNKMDGMYGFY